MWPLFWFEHSWRHWLESVPIPKTLYDKVHKPLSFPESWWDQSVVSSVVTLNTTSKKAQPKTDRSRNQNDEERRFPSTLRTIPLGAISRPIGTVINVCTGAAKMTTIPNSRNSRIRTLTLLKKTVEHVSLEKKIMADKAGPVMKPPSFGTITTLERRSSRLNRYIWTHRTTVGRG